MGLRNSVFSLFTSIIVYFIPTNLNAQQIPKPPSTIPEVIDVNKYITESSTSDFGLKGRKTFIIKGTEWPVDVLLIGLSNTKNSEVKYIDSYYNRKWSRESENGRMRMTYWNGLKGPLYNKTVATSSYNVCPYGWEMPSVKDFEELLNNTKHIRLIYYEIFNDNDLGSFRKNQQASAAYWTKGGNLFSSNQRAFIIARMSDAACIKCVRKNQIIKEGESYVFGDSKYYGSVENSIPNGKGKLVLNDNTIIEGEFVDGVLQGDAKVISPGFGELEGFFINGEIRKGQIRYVNGSFFKGEISKFEPHGNGFFVSRNRNVYSGNFSNGYLNGEGSKYISQTGVELFGDFKKGKANGEIAHISKQGKITPRLYAFGEDETEEKINNVAVKKVDSIEKKELAKIEKRNSNLVFKAREDESFRKISLLCLVHSTNPSPTRYWDIRPDLDDKSALNYVRRMYYMDSKVKLDRHETKRLNSSNPADKDILEERGRLSKKFHSDVRNLDEQCKIFRKNKYQSDFDEIKRITQAWWNGNYYQSDELNSKLEILYAEGKRKITERRQLQKEQRYERLKQEKISYTKKLEQHVLSMIEKRDERCRMNPGSCGCIPPEELANCNNPNAPCACAI
jgi:uncharacterized protein (TIGR02145 family)